MFTSALKMFGDLPQKMGLPLCFLSCALEPTMYSFRIVNRIRKTQAPQKRKKKHGRQQKDTKAIQKCKSAKTNESVDTEGPRKGPIVLYHRSFFQKIVHLKGDIMLILFMGSFLGVFLD